MDNSHLINENSNDSAIVQHHASTSLIDVESSAIATISNELHLELDSMSRSSSHLDNDDDVDFDEDFEAGGRSNASSSSKKRGGKRGSAKVSLPCVK